MKPWASYLVLIAFYGACMADHAWWQAAACGGFAMGIAFWRLVKLARRDRSDKKDPTP